MNRFTKYLGLVLWAMVVCASCGGNSQRTTTGPLFARDSMGESSDGDEGLNINGVIDSNRKLYYLFFLQTAG